MPKRKPRPVTVSAPQKGRSKSKTRDCARRAARRPRHRPPRSRDEKDPGSGAGRGQAIENEAEESARTAFTTPGDAQVVQGGPPRLVGYARI